MISEDKNEIARLNRELTTYKLITEKLANALTSINREEERNQRPGGSISAATIISAVALMAYETATKEIL